MPTTPPTCPAGSEPIDPTKVIVWVTEAEMAAAAGDLWDILKYLGGGSMGEARVVADLCASPPAGPFDFDLSDLVGAVRKDPLGIFNVLHVLANRLDWEMFLTHCQCAAGSPTSCQNFHNLTYSPSATSTAASDRTLAQRFTMTADRVATQLGIRFGSAQPRNSSYLMGLWSNAGTLLASATVSTPGTSNLYYTADITPVELTNGQTYRVGFYVPSGGIIPRFTEAHMGSLTRNDRTLNGANENVGTGLAFPSAASSFWWAADVTTCTASSPTSIDPLPEAEVPTGVDLPPAPPACTESQLCLDVATLLKRVSAISEEVKVIQRQAAPFGMTAQTATSVSGSGTLAVSAILALRVDFTAIPSYKGHRGTAAVDYFDLGYLSFGDSNGLVDRRVLRHDPQWIENVPGWATTVRYDLAPGVSATITPYRRLM